MQFQPTFQWPGQVPNQMYGKTRYHYRTADGGPPCDGKVPTDKLPGFNTLAGIPSVAAPQPTYPPFGNYLLRRRNIPYMSNYATGLGFGQGFVPGFGPAQPSAFSQNGWVCYQNTTNPFGATAPPAPAATATYYPPPPPPPPPPANYSTPVPPYEKVEPLNANRVNGELGVFTSSGAGYLFPPDPVSFKLFYQNVINKYNVNAVPGDVITVTNDKHTKQMIDRNRTWGDLIEAVESKKRAHHHNHDYPDHGIGVQELIPQPGGPGRFKVGAKILLTHAMVNQEIGQYWTKTSNEERWLVRCPC